MNHETNSIEDWLIEIDNKSKAIINLGKQLHTITSQMQVFDFLLIAALNRTINLNKAFTSLIRDGNFIAAAPLVRINLDTLMRLFASIISEHDRNTFANKIMSGEAIKKMKAKNSKANLRDSYLVEQLSEIEDMKLILESTIGKKDGVFWEHTVYIDLYDNFQVSIAGGKNN